MRALIRNVWLLSLGIFCFAPHAWLRARQDQMMETFPVEHALALVGVVLTGLCALLYVIFSARGMRFSRWAFAPSYSEHLGRGALPGAGARQMLRLGVTVGAFVGIAAVPVGLLLLSWDEGLKPPTYAARRMAIHESRSLRLDIPRLLETVPGGGGALALALAPGESDVQDLAESEILGYELFPRRVERVWIEDCESGLSAEQAAQFDAVIYQCNRGDAYSWRGPSEPMPDYWRGFDAPPAGEAP